MVDPADVNLADIYRLMAQGSVIPSWCSGDPDMDCVVGSGSYGWEFLQGGEAA
jgi:hypothetical protein